MDPSAIEQVAGVYHRRVGDILVTALHDGHQDVAITTVQNISGEDAVALLHASYRPVPRRTAVNTFVIRSAGRTALVDTGCGPAKPTVGMLPANMATAGIAADQVDTVLMTHLHPDHFGGLVWEGQARFPGAELLLHEAEHTFWHDDAAMNRMTDPARRKIFFGDARDSLLPYRDRLRLIRGGTVFPGVTAVPLPGHTPGHTGYLIDSGGKSLLIWGDIVHVPEIQVPRPEATMAVDVDPEQTIATRRRLFERVASERLAIAGMHLHFPALAHLGREGGGFALYPDAWTTVLDGDAPSL